jgi:hypothetical protein
LTIQGCFIQSVDYTDLDYSSSESVLIQMNVRFDHAFQDIGGYNAGEGIALGEG